MNQLTRLRVLPAIIPADGKPAELRQAEGYIQWRVQGDESWQNLVALADIEGPAGAQGPSTQWRINGEYLQSAPEGTEDWSDTVPLADITGPAGGINYLGEWVAGTYPYNSIVEHDGSLWYANTDTSEEPGNTANDWDLFLPGSGPAAGSVDETKLEPNLNARLTRSFRAVSEMLADTVMAYSSGPLRVAVGDIIEAQGFRYEVATSEATDAHLETAGGVKLNHVHEGTVDIEALGASVSGSATENTVAIQKANDALGSSGALVISGDGYHHNELQISNSLIGPGRLIYDGAAEGLTFASSRVTIEGVTIDSNGNDAALVYVSNATGVVIGNGATVQNGYNNVVINGVSNALEIGAGAHIKNARNDNVFCIQGKRFNISDGAFISGAAGWGVNCDSTTAAAPDQQHGFTMHAQIWGNKAGAYRIVGTPTNYVQHPIIGGHIDHNQNDATSDPAYGIYMDYVMRPIIEAGFIRSSRTVGMHLDHVSLPTVIGVAFWKNGKSYEITANCSRPFLIGIREDDVPGTIANPADAIVVGQAIRSWSDMVSGNGYFKFGDLGHLRQFLTGGGAGNAELNLNSPTANRTVTMRNGSDLTTQFRFVGTIGQRVFPGAPSGTITHMVQARDENGTLIGNIPVYTS